MFRMLSVAFLLVASPAMAAQSASEIKVDENGQAYKIKKVCRTVEVSGSFIPRTTCVNKKVPVKNPQAEGQEASATPGGSAAGETVKAPENQ